MPHPVLYIPSAGSYFYIMGPYPARVYERLTSAKHAGRTLNANGVGTSASFVCGCFVRISIAVDGSSKKIADARFQTNGCGFMVASADLMAERLSGRCLPDLGSMDEADLIRYFEAELGPLPSERAQCVRGVREAARSALADFRTFVLEGFSGEKALICTCFGVSEDTIEAFLAAGEGDSVDDVTRALRAGGGCGSCRMLIQEMLDQHAREG